jgi:hypothetical protein
MSRNKLLQNFIIYLLLIAGYLLFYVYPVNEIFFNHENEESSSKVDFIYQQF